MHTEDILNLVQCDWTSHNQQVLKHCKEQAEAFVFEQMQDYPDTRHRASVRGNMLWDQFDRALEQASIVGLFEGITHAWVKYRGAEILALSGKRTSLTAKHVLTRDEVLADSQEAYRTNNKIKNQQNLELFKDFDSEPDDEVLHIVLQHGGKGGLFAHLKAYFIDSCPLTLSEDLMLLPDLDAAEATEFVLQPSVTLKSPSHAEETATMPEMAILTEEDDSQS